MKNARDKYYQYIRDNITIHDVCRKLNIAIKPVGDDYICRCFGHKDEHPSMHLYTASKRYYCFQCGESGDIFSFVKGVKNYDFKECLNWIEGAFPEVLSEKPLIGSQQDGSLQNGFEIAFSCYSEMDDSERNQLLSWAKSRKYNPEFLYDAEVFFARGRKLLSAYQSEDQFIEEKNKLEDVKLFKKLSKGLHDIKIGRDEDFFKQDRIIITLRDSNRNIVGFAGRRVDEHDNPKYLFTPNLNKKGWLYRFAHIRDSGSRIKKNQTEELYLTEGIFDALRLEQRRKRAVAVLGSHLLQSQSQVIAEYVMQSSHPVTINVFMDSDEAGLQGNYDTIRNLWQHSILRRTYICVKVIIGEEKDPDEYYKQRSNADTTNLVTYSALEYLFRYLLRDSDQSLNRLDVAEAYRRKTVEERIQVLHTIENMLSKEEWQEIFEWHSSVYPENTLETEKEFDGWQILQNYVQGIGQTKTYE